MSLATREPSKVERYGALVEELQALKTEEAFDMGVRHIQWAHWWGKTIRDYHATDQGLDSLLDRVSIDVGRSKRTLYRYVELYDRFPQIETEFLKHGKNVSINLLLGGESGGKELAEPRPPCNRSCVRCCK